MTHRFTLVVRGEHELTPGLADALFAAGLDDATPCSRGRTLFIHLDRESPSLGLAIDSAIAQVESVGMKVDSITLDDD